jgi:DNA-binding NarL/FixJ family response regulator
MIRVLVVEERPAVRAGLKRLLAMAGEITVVGESQGPGEAAEVASRVDCDLVVFGIASPGPESLESIVLLTHAVPRLHVLAVGPGQDPGPIREALARGASGYVDIARAREDLVKAVRLVCRGGVFSSATEGERRGPREGPSSAKASRVGSSGRGRSASAAGAAGGTRPR